MSDPTPDSVRLAHLRSEYMREGLRESDLDASPTKQLAAWLRRAIDGGLRDANAMTLATASRDAVPSARIVLLKDLDDRGLVFYTNYQSHKGRELADNPRASLLFFWPELERQVRIDGAVDKVSREESEAYFHSRPEASQLGAWASPQSCVVSDRAVLEARFRELTNEYAGKPIPLPPHWGGYRVVPSSFEFWQGRESRLHDRLRYTREPTGNWKIERLAP